MSMKKMDLKEIIIIKKIITKRNGKYYERI